MKVMYTVLWKLWPQCWIRWFKSQKSEGGWLVWIVCVYAELFRKPVRLADRLTLLVKKKTYVIIYMIKTAKKNTIHKNKQLTNNNTDKANCEVRWSILTKLQMKKHWDNYSRVLFGWLHFVGRMYVTLIRESGEYIQTVQCLPQKCHKMVIVKLTLSGQLYHCSYDCVTKEPDT